MTKTEKLAVVLAALLILGAVHRHLEGPALFPGPAHATPVGGCVSQVEFTQHEVDYQSLHYYTDLSAADFDGDGDPDLVAAAGDTIDWYENLDGAGGFGEPRTITEDGGGVTSIFATDIDGDGDNDILAASNGRHRIAWYENSDGLGSFESYHLVTSEAEGAHFVTAADLDGDDHPDVLYAADSNVIWRRNTDGAGSFGPARVISTYVQQARSALAADLDGDGDLDVLTAGLGAYFVGWYENLDGEGSFGIQRNVAVIQGASLALAADVDGDQDLDVLAISTGQEEKVCWYENTGGTGVFGPERIIASSEAETAAVADLDNDGDLDVVSNNKLSGRISWYENLDGSGTFGPEVIAFEHFGASYFVGAVDVDGDADDDLIEGAYYSVDWYENGLDDCNRNGVHDSCEDPGVAAACVDVDNDGFPLPDDCDDGTPLCTIDCTDADADGYCVTTDCDDAMPYCATDCEPCAEDCDSDGVPDPFAIAVRFAATSLAGPYDDAQAVMAADLDSDGDLDALAAINEDAVVWFENTDGQGDFGAMQVVGEGDPQSIRSMDAADLDGDGDSDVVFAAWPDLVAWYPNDGDDGFGIRRILPHGNSGPWAVRAADLDGDGDTDLLVGGGAIVWIENVSGDGLSWQVHTFDTVVDGEARSVFAADLDGDEDLDVLVAKTQDSRVSWYENLDGQGTFGTEQGLSWTAENASAVFAVDVDGDGDMDAISASAGSNETDWYENLDGHGSFGPKQPVSLGVDIPVALFAADLDNDGDPDLLTATSNDGLVWNENRDGAGNFGPRHLIPIDHDLYISSVVAADFDGDGDLDVLSGCYYTVSTETVAWHENLRDNCNDNELPDACEDPYVAAACTDIDRDGYNVLTDCDDADTHVWSEPGPVSGLSLSLLSPPETQLSWPEPDEPGATLVRYDTLRSPEASDFTIPAVCLEWDAENREATDHATPAPGVALFYLIRVENDCPGSVGNLGADSVGTPRAGRVCP